MSASRRLPPTRPHRLDRTNNSDRHDKAKCLRFSIRVAPQGAALYVRDSGVRIDIEAAHSREVNDQSACTTGMTRNRVATTPDGNQEVLPSSELHRVDHVGGSSAPHDERGTRLMHRVVDWFVGISGISRCQHISANR